MAGQDFDWHDLFRTSESPYFAMFRCGCMGIPIQECIDYCATLNIPLRAKDITSWQDGDWSYQTHRQSSVLNPLLRPGTENFVPILESELSDFQTWPHGWSGTTRRWFPCTLDNMPMQKWGYSAEYTPVLYEREEAQALAPCRWVGQNLYAQPFIVIDIDGRGHGDDDEEVIEFGTRFRHMTETWENPCKPGSFHLYFSTHRQIPISHFPYAKLDLMGNQKNAAVYTKDKQSNGVPRRELDDEFWGELKHYLNTRLQRRSTMESAGLLCQHEGREAT